MRDYALLYSDVMSQVQRSQGLVQAQAVRDGGTVKPHLWAENQQYVHLAPALSRRRECRPRAGEPTPSCPMEVCRTVA